MKEKWHIFKTTHKSGLRLLRVVRIIDRDLIPLSLIETSISAMTPYIGLVLSARIIDLLLQKKFESAVTYVIVMLVTLLCTGLINTVIKYKTGVSQRLLQTNLEIAIRSKAMTLEYEIMSDPEIQKALRNAEDAAKYRGGLGILVSVYKELLQYGISAVTAIVFIVLFCIAKGDSNSGVLGFITHPVVTITCLAAAWIAGMLLSSNQAKKIKAIEDHIASKHYEIENQLSYWQFEVIHDIESGKTIRMNSMENLILENIRKFMSSAEPLYEAMGISSSKRILSESIESGIFSVVAYTLVIIKVLTYAITTGAFMQYSGAILQFHKATAKIVWSESEVNRLIKILLPLADYMDRENLRHTGTLPIEKRMDHVYELEFHDVGFCYPNSEAYILKHINAKIDVKSKIAIVGQNGAGKTTFIKLLCRLYEPTEGYITLNGIDIRKYDYEEYLSLFGVVLQDFHLFSSSIAENVATSKKYDSDKIEKLLKQSGVWHFVSKLENGMETYIGNGTESAIDLSGGQSQKISIARALYKDAPFVILDEPTAALDPISEAEIYEKFDEMVEGKTSIYISHRMSSCRFCDEVIVFNDGEIAQRGSHENLLSLEGLYKTLWSAQAQYYA